MFLVLVLHGCLMAYKIYISLYIFSLILFSCSEPEDLEDNVLDPGGEEYEAPTVFFSDNIFQDAIFSEESVTIILSGNELVSEYRVQLDNNLWSEWSEDNTFILDYLDEGAHVVSGQTRYPSSEESEIISFEFTVDAVGGPSLMFFPRRQYAVNGDFLTFSIHAEEVEALAGAELIINYNPSQVLIESISPGSVFTVDGEPIFFSEVNQEENTITVTTAVWGQNYPSFSGTGSLVELMFQVVSSGEIDFFIHENSLFRNAQDGPIEISEFIPGKILAN